MPDQFSKTDCCVGTNARLFIVCRLGQLLKELSVDGSVGKFGDEDKYRFQGLLSDDGLQIREARYLTRGVSKEWPDREADSSLFEETIYRSPSLVAETQL